MLNLTFVTSVTLLFILPLFSVLCLAIPAWFGQHQEERTVATIVAFSFTFTVICLLTSCVCFVLSGHVPLTVDLGDWFRLGHHSFPIKFVADKLSLAFVGFSSVLVGLIGKFSERYLHREFGYRRFYLLLSLFGASVNYAALASSLDMVFIGWEMVGVTSALLIAFFDHRKNPVEHGLRAFIIYRICDVGILAAVVWCDYRLHGSSFSFDHGHHWFALSSKMTTLDQLIIALGIVWGTMGKAAQVPFSGWFPRAMEGPTPSSAIFYGAISVHLGPFLLLRVFPILEPNIVVQLIIITIGLVTAIHATSVGRVQTDIKSLLAYASMTQVGVIYMEIGLGLYWLALFHIVGHAFIRTLQILRAPNILHDYSYLEQALGTVLPKTGGHIERRFSVRIQQWLYRHALERSYLDGFLTDFVVHYWNVVIKRVDLAEKRWIEFLGGKKATSPVNRED